MKRIFTLLTLFMALSAILQAKHRGNLLFTVTPYLMMRLTGRFCNQFHKTRPTTVLLLT